MDREILQELIDEGLTVRAIADRQGVSYSTIRYWLKRHGLTTPRARRLAQTLEARQGGHDRAHAYCEVHGWTVLVPRPSGGFRCLRCRNAAVSDRRRRMKRLLVAEAGGCCAICGYDRCIAALQFHHVDPAVKTFAVAGKGLTRSLAASRAEAAKCVLLCANCHAEVEAGERALPYTSASTDPG